MNTSQLLTDIKMDLGIYALRLPFDDPDKVLLDVVINRTIPVFSTTLPDIIEMYFDCNILRVSDNGTNKGIYRTSNGSEGEVDATILGSDLIVRLPDFMERTLLFVKDIKFRNQYGGMYSVPFNQGHMSPFYNNMMMAKASLDLMSTASPSITIEFKKPNMLKIYNMTSLTPQIMIELAVTHASNLSTISPTSQENFYKLALLDVKRFLYNAMKHYTELQTAFGTVNLRIDDWANAESERQDLLDRWDDVYQLELTQLHII